MKTLQIVCAGGHGKVVAEVAEQCGYEQIVFVDLDWPARKTHGRWPIVSDTVIHDGKDVFYAAGSNSLRQQLFEVHQLNCPTLVHPAAIVSRSAILAPGCIVMPGVVINAGATIGKGVILNTSCSVDHDCNIGDFVHVAPGARLAGNVTVGNGTWIGIGASIIQNISIGHNAIVAAGATVVSHVNDNLMVGGIPAVRMHHPA